MNWQGKNILVTGGRGFLGTHLVRKVKALSATVYAPSHDDFDLVHESEIKKMYSAYPDVDVVIHLAARVGGISANREHPGSFFYDNLMMGVQLLHHAYQRHIPKFVALGTVCAYPKYTLTPFKEEDLWAGYPEETNAPYGLAKKMMLVQSQGYRQEYGYNSIFLLPVNLYGPGDNFDPRHSHVIPALIKKCVDAVENGDKEVAVWGDGSASREFLYVEDAAEGIILATEQYNKSDPVNLGSAFEITIKDLIELIAKETGFSGKITWDTSKPNGQPRRKLDISLAEKEFGFKPRITLEEGLRQTIKWYTSHKIATAY
jgi:GDP-L-fucose synthase